MHFLGYKFDFVIDISGHHEIVHPLTRNVDFNLPLDWPRGYFNDAKNFITDYSCLENNKKLQKINSKVPIIEILSLIYIIDCKKKVNPRIENKYFQIKDYKGINEIDIINKSINIWQRSVEEINSFTSSNNTKFISVIMPSQYQQNSKELTEYEKNNLLGNNEYGEVIKKYYSNLDYLENSKIEHKLDLREIFKTEVSTMYSDNCCRYSEKGIEIILEEIINKIKN